jgi:hypothetical protein
MLTDNQIRKQSEQAVMQWGEQWEKHCVTHKKHFPEMKPLDELKNIGIGRALVLVANGASFERQIEDLKGDSDILCCDKTLGHLLDNGITPTYCLVCDANVDYETYMEKYSDKLQDTTLIMCITANPKWSTNGNWKDVYFFANKDILQSEVKYMALSGCKSAIPAATNVSNAMIVFATQSDNHGRANFMGYDVYGLVGFDYSWEPLGNYYAFNKNGNGKHNYMRHSYLKNTEGNRVYTSANLEFSAKWITRYCQTYNLPIVQCSDSTIFQTKKTLPLSKVMNYNYKKEDQAKVKTMGDKARKLKRELDSMLNELNKIGSDHSKHFMALA